MWLLFCVAVSLSFGTYISSDQHGLIAGIGNTVDLVVVWATFGSLFVIKRGRLEFNRFETGCFIASGLILIFWIYTGAHVIANLALQAIMIIAYFPLFKNLYKAEKNTEPFWVWMGVLTSAAFALYPAVADRNLLAIIYVGRAIICIVLVLGLIARIKIRSHAAHARF